MLNEMVDFLVQSIGSMGYVGIFSLMFLESTFFPFPSEVVMIPAGYLAFQGDMNLGLVIAVGTLGSIMGALFNYFLARQYGEKVLLKFIKAPLLDKVKYYFKKHGSISTFTSRLIPGIRQYISLPAGLSHMPLGKFVLFTGLGAGLWVSVLVGIGYVAGANETLVKEYLHAFTLYAFMFIAAVIFIYIKVKKS